MTTLQTEWTARELLETDAVVEPLYAGGVRCHGGLDEAGAYVSPRTKNRLPAIAAWQQQRADAFGTPLLDIPLSTWPENYPNVKQAKFLLEEGVADPIIATLTRIGTVEGFGAMIRYSMIPDWQRCFDEDVRGTALAHLDKGLFEAHARDEAGYGDEGGHKQMWFAARDVAFDNPISEDQSQIMLQRMGLVRTGAGGSAKAVVPEPLFPDIDPDLEMLLVRMTSLLLIEISAFHVFAWAEEVLADTDLVGGEGEAARLVSYVRADETPHVEYLKTVLSEMRDRTFVGQSGRTYPGTEVVGRIWDRAKADSLGVRREQNMALTVREVEHALAGHARGGEILAQFHALAS
ncbi:MAG: uncharacterized protein QOI20_666 [Acidimicrobiaceae bacterium]|jgi:hypothetical protein|nr:uncharacterized protein [Acidimicrobiaceae bacterium]